MSMSDAAALARACGEVHEAPLGFTATVNGHQLRVFHRWDDAEAVGVCQVRLGQKWVRMRLAEAIALAASRGAA